MKRLFLTLTILCSLLAAFSQPVPLVTISGKLTDRNTGEAISGVSVKLKKGSGGAVTDVNGIFQFPVSSLPATLLISHINFEPQEIKIVDQTELSVSLVPVPGILEPVVLSSKGIPTRIIDHTSSAEMIGLRAVRQLPALSPYDATVYKTQIDLTTSSLTFKTPSSRGFNGSGSTRVNQIVDGMDNQAPGLNFFVGNFAGIPDIDLESIELLPGASSALYGPGGMNGTILINSKNPFKHQGLSFQVKTGIMHTDGRGREPSPYHNWSLRWAQKVSDRFAFKIGSELIQAKDWLADDYRNYKRLGTTGSIVTGTRETDPQFDGVNIYGDETTNSAIPTFKNILGSIGAAVPFLRDYVMGLLPSISNEQKVSRTGYREADVVDPNTLNYKFSGAIHFKINDKIEAIAAGHLGTGNTIYTGSDRYSFKDLKMAQYKLEIRSDKWYIRGYTTQENAGQSHNLTVTTQLFNEEWKPSSAWYQEYAFGFLNAKMAGKSDIDAHNIARAISDQGRPAAGSTEFKTLFDQVRKKPIPQGGLLLDRSDLWMAEGQYNFSESIKIFDVIVGANWKRYKLNSEGTLFADKPGEPITIDEVGAYIQVGKEIIPDLLRLTAAGRYDKNENFEGRFTPRVTALIKAAKDHNIRVSFQTAYRFPSTQQQWIDLNVGSGRIIGANKTLWDKYELTTNNGYDPATVPPQGTGLTRVPYIEAKPESVRTFELGYKSLIDRKLLIDAYIYYGEYEDFLTRRDVIQFDESNSSPTLADPYTGYSVVVNTPEKVKTYGWAASIEWLLPASFAISANASSDKISDIPSGFRAFFNAPDLRTVLALGNTGFGPKKLLGFNVSWRWQDGFFYENDFSQGDLPAYHTVDAVISFKQPKIKSMFKLGANNLLNQYYRTAVGNPSIGGLYYISFAYNVL